MGLGHGQIPEVAVGGTRCFSHFFLEITVFFRDQIGEPRGDGGGCCAARKAEKGAGQEALGGRLGGAGGEAGVSARGLAQGSPGPELTSRRPPPAPGRCVDLHGAHGHVPGQVLPEGA